MSKEEADFLDDLRALSITAAHEFLSGIDRLKQFRNEWRDGDEGPDPKRVKRNDLAFDLARAEIRRAEMILSLSHTQADMLFDNAKKLIRRARSGNDAPSKVIDLSKVDGEWKAELTISNPLDTPADPRAEASFFTDSAGEPFEPLGRLALQAPRSVGAGARTTLVFTLPAANLPDGVYFADLEVFVVGDIDQRVARRRVRLRHPAAARAV